MTSCDSQPVAFGRGKFAVAALALVLALGGSAAAQPVTLPAKKRVKVVFFKARVASDGFITPGKPETVTVFSMPPKTSFQMGIEPPPITLQCGQFFFCDVALAF